MIRDSMINMTRLSVIFCIIIYIIVLLGHSQASIYEVLGKNLSSELKEGLENAGSTTRRTGTEKGWHTDDYFTQHRDSFHRDKQSRNENDGIYSTQGSRSASGSSSSYGEGQHWDQY